MFGRLNSFQYDAMANFHQLLNFYSFNTPQMNTGLFAPNFSFSQNNTPKITSVFDTLHELKMGYINQRNSMLYNKFQMQQQYNYSNYQPLFTMPQLNFNYQTQPVATQQQTTQPQQTTQSNSQTPIAPTSTKLKGFNINKYPKAEVDNAIKLYQQMGLDKRGLNKEVFLAAVIGYNRLSDKGNGYLAIVDTTQSRNAKRYYLVDMKNKRFVDQTAVKLGKNSMANALRANVAGSNASLSGFMKFGIEYESPSANAKRRWKRGIKLHGFESGINNNALSKGVVAHCTELNTTAGCIGITAVLNSNGGYNYPASFAKLRKFCPSGAIVFTAPTGTDYWQSSKIFA